MPGIYEKENPAFWCGCIELTLLRGNSHQAVLEQAVRAVCLVTQLSPPLFPNPSLCLHYR